MLACWVTWLRTLGSQGWRSLNPNSLHTPAVGLVHRAVATPAPTQTDVCKHMYPRVTSTSAQHSKLVIRQYIAAVAHVSQLNYRRQRGLSGCKPLHAALLAPLTQVLLQCLLVLLLVLLTA